MLHSCYVNFILIFAKAGAWTEGGRGVLTPTEPPPSSNPSLRKWQFTVSIILSIICSALLIFSLLPLCILLAFLSNDPVPGSVPATPQVIFIIQYVYHCHSQRFVPSWYWSRIRGHELRTAACSPKSKAWAKGAQTTTCNDPPAAWWTPFIIYYVC